MEDSIFIRQALPEDAQSIIQFNICMAWETEGKKLDKDLIKAGVSRVLSEQAEAFYLVAVNHDNLIVASLMVTKEWSDWRNAFIWWIQSVYVLPKYRRKGIYSKLYAKVKELGISNSCCGFRLYVEKNNISAQKTYSKLGMKHSHYLVYEDISNEG